MTQFDRWWVSTFPLESDDAYHYAKLAWESATAAERERAAVMCEVHAATVMYSTSGTPWSACHECAAAIRAG